MEGTDIPQKADVSKNDYSYFGNGCPGDDTAPDQFKSCSTRTANTFDSETQEIGVYYSFQAATSGSGGTIKTSNINAPDTFCPLGWQLPYSGTGGDYYDKSRSLKFLFEKYNLSDTQESAIRFRSYPFSYILSGRIRFSVGGLRFLNAGGFFFPSTAAGTDSAFRLEVWPTALRYNNGGVGMTFGYNLRCALKL